MIEETIASYLVLVLFTVGVVAGAPPGHVKISLKYVSPAYTFGWCPLTGSSLSSFDAPYPKGHFLLAYVLSSKASMANLLKIFMPILFN